MRFHTPLNQENIKTHYTYSKWKYLLVLAAMLLVWMVFDMTRPQPKETEKIEVYVQSNTSSTEAINAFLKPLWESAAPEMKKVDSVVLSMYDETTTNMQLTTYIFVGQGDIYFLSGNYFKDVASSGALLPLENLVADGRIRVDGSADLQKGYVTVVTEHDDKGNPTATEQHLYGIPLDSYFGFMKGMQLDNRGMYACIIAANKNDDNVIPFLDALLQAGQGEKEDWITE